MFNTCSTSQMIEEYEIKDFFLTNMIKKRDRRGEIIKTKIIIPQIGSDQIYSDPKKKGELIKINDMYILFIIL